eukprot:TRINITY_DN41959_c0_g1_i1.p3 TRINITY_DN41959_c0_g1~~TRINITY_DN41959_c0_g1_i1.p3  ORF type:complete len:105 (-),score=12.53 TRINITY_DN41959_c0_g1_i1:356-670(-)
MAQNISAHSVVACLGVPIGAVQDRRLRRTVRVGQRTPTSLVNSPSRHEPDEPRQAEPKEYVIKARYPPARAIMGQILRRASVLVGVKLWLPLRHRVGYTVIEML